MKAEAGADGSQYHLFQFSPSVHQRKKRGRRFLIDLPLAPKLNPRRILKFRGCLLPIGGGAADVILGPAMLEARPAKRALLQGAQQG